MKKLYVRFALILFFTGFAPAALWAQFNGGKKILLVVTSSDVDLAGDPNGIECREATDFYAEMYKAGFRLKDIDIVSPKGGQTPLTYWLFDTMLPSAEEMGFRNKLDAALKPSQINTSDYNAVYYVGGWGPFVDFPSNPQLAAISSQIYEAGGIVAAVCDGICGLIPVKLSNGDFLVKGKQITTNAYQHGTYEINTRGLLESEGAMYINQISVSKDRLITVQGVRPRVVATEMLKLLNITTGISSVSGQGDFSIYPNPCNGKFMLNSSTMFAEEVNVVIVDMHGAMVYEKHLQYGSNAEVYLEDTKAGIYLVMVRTGSDSYTRRIEVR